MRGEQLNVEDGTKVKCSCYGDVRYIYDDDYAKKVEELRDEWYRYQILRISRNNFFQFVIF